MGDRGWNERWQGWTGRDEPDVAARKLRSIRRLVLVTLACEGWLAIRYVPYSSHPEAYGLVALALTGCAIAGWGDRLARWAAALAWLLLFGVVVSVLPDNANHQFLALLLLTLVLLVEPDRTETGRDTVAALQSMRWIAAIGIFWAGVMKLHYGYFLHGDFLAFRIAHDPGFARVLGVLVPASELARLTALENSVGAGPYRPDAPLLVVVSNLTWLAELALPVGLLWPRTRRFAMVAAILLFVAIQLAAREIFFGGLMVGLLLLYAERDRVSQALPWITGVYLFWLSSPAWTHWLEQGRSG